MLEKISIFIDVRLDVCPLFSTGGKMRSFLDQLFSLKCTKFPVNPILPLYSRSHEFHVNWAKELSFIDPVEGVLSILFCSPMEENKNVSVIAVFKLNGTPQTQQLSKAVTYRGECQGFHHPGWKILKGIGGGGLPSPHPPPPLLGPFCPTATYPSYFLLSPRL